jgi:hypothetical protein
VTQFTAEASGFTAQFNQPVDATVLNLYDTEAGALGPADVTVVGANQGTIKGSLVANGNQLTFVKAGGILAPDDYTVTMRSATNGIKGADGSLLDGNSDGTSGDDYVNTFTVDQSAPVVISVADFARGPAQFINPGIGFPVTLSEGTDVTDVQFSLNFDPALLKITEVHLGSSLPAGTQLQSDLSQSGVATVHINSPSPMNSGAVELVRLIAQVPANAVYTRAGVLDLNLVSVNHEAIASVGDDGVQVVGYLGDTSGNQRYSSLDGSRTLRVVAGLDSGFAQYPTINPTIIADITGNGTLSSLDATRILQEVVGLDRPEIPDIVPVILVGLVEDTGVSNTDGITSNPAVSGTVSDDGTITSFRAGLDNMLPENFVDVTADLQGTSFVFSRDRLEQILGAPLADGPHTVHLQAVDNAGIGPFFGGSTAPSPVFDPGAPSPIFTPGGPVPVFISGAPSPTFNPLAPSPIFTPGAPVPLFDESLSSNTSNVDLTFTLETSSPAIMALGFSAGSDTGAAGDNSTASAQVTLTVTTDVSLQWNHQALEAIRLTAMDPPPAARVLAMVSLAQYDTLAAIDGTLAYLVQQSVAGPVSVDAALAEAAYTVLYALFPTQRSVFDATLNSLLETISDGPAKTSAVALGLSIGSDILSIRSNDGSDVFVDYPGSTDVGMWHPDAPMFDVASEPQWGDVTPFALTSGDEFRPDAPPALDSALYAQSVNEIQSMGSATSSTRTEDQTQIAEFWADGKSSYTPAGQWDLIAQQIAISAGNSLSSNVRLFAELNVALADSGIAAWDSKYKYGLWRPIDAIRNAGLDGNAATIADPGWSPLLITPSFPEYTSGQSTFSAAAAAILAATFGDNTSFSTTAFMLPGVTRNFTSFTQAAQEAGRSQIYAGIDYEFSNQIGQQLGAQVAAAVLDRFSLSKDLQPPDILADPTPEAVSANITFTGQILDNLSGVAQAIFRIDDGTFQTLSLDAQRNFSITTALALDGSSDGLHTITIRAEDADGNIAPDFMRSFTLDTH